MGKSFNVGDEVVVRGYGIGELGAEWNGPGRIARIDSDGPTTWVAVDFGEHRKHHSLGGFAVEYVYPLSFEGVTYDE